MHSIRLKFWQFFYYFPLKFINLSPILHNIRIWNTHVFTSLSLPILVPSRHTRPTRFTRPNKPTKGMPSNSIKIWRLWSKFSNHLQDPRTSALTTAHTTVAASSQSWPAHGHTPSPSSMTRPTPLTASQCPATVTCPSTGRLMATPRGPSTRTTTPHLWTGTGQVRTGRLGVENLTQSLTHYMYCDVFVPYVGIVEICQGALIRVFKFFDDFFGTKTLR